MVRWKRSQPSDTVSTLSCVSSFDFLDMVLVDRPGLSHHFTFNTLHGEIIVAFKNGQRS